MKERRKDPRLRTYIGGRIVFNNRFSTLDCLLRNLSQNGAKLVFSGPVALPFEFDLHLLNRAEIRKGRLIWYRESQAGIAMNRTEAGAIVSIEATRRIRQLEAERDQLRRRLAELNEPS